MRFNEKSLFRQTFFVVFVLLLPFQGCSKKPSRKKPASSGLRYLQGVPILPNARFRVLTNTSKHLAVDLDADTPVLRAMTFYRNQLRHDRFSFLEEEPSSHGQVLTFQRGYFRLSISFSAKGSVGVEIKIRGERLTEPEVLTSRPPPLPKDLELPASITWDHRIFAAKGDDVEIRGKSSSVPEEILRRMESSFSSSGWKATRTETQVVFQKADRKVTVKAWSLTPRRTAVRVLLASSEIMAPRPATSPEKPRPKGPNEKIPLDAGTRSGSAPIKKSLSKLKVPEGFRRVEGHSMLSEMQIIYVNRSTNTKQLVKAVVATFKEQGFRQIPQPAQSASRTIHILVFQKKDKMVTATLQPGSEGTTLTLMVSN